MSHPRTDYNDGEALPADDLNADHTAIKLGMASLVFVSDNIPEPDADLRTANAQVDIGTSWQAIADELEATLTTDANTDLILVLKGQIRTGTTRRASFDFSVDGTRLGNAFVGGLVSHKTPDDGEFSPGLPFTLIHAFTPGAGSHTIIPQCKADSGSVYIPYGSNFSPFKFFIFAIGNVS